MSETKPLLCACLHSYCSRSGLYWWDAFSHGKGNTSRHTVMLQSCVKKSRNGRLTALNEDKMYAGYSPGHGNDSLILTEEEESHASEHWKDAYLPCRHHHSCGALSSRLE